MLKQNAMFNLLNLTLKSDCLAVSCCPMASASSHDNRHHRARPSANLTVSLSSLKWIFDSRQLITKIVNIVKVLGLFDLLVNASELRR